MRKSIKILLVILLISMLAVFTGCAKEDSKSGEKKISIRVAGQSPVDNPDSKALYEIAEEVNKKSNGRIEMRIYPANQLGDYTAVHEEIMRGTIEMGLISTSPEHDDRLLIGYMPYIVENYEMARELYKPNAFMYKTYKDIHKDLNTEFLGFWAEGIGVLGATKIPNNLADPEADKGLVLRVPPIDGVRLSVSEQGYRTTSIAYSDLYSALETGIADGWVGGSELLNYTGFRDVLKCVVPINNFFETTFFLANQDFWDGLSPEDQKIIREAIEKRSKDSLELVEEVNMEYRQKLKDAGIEVIGLSDAEVGKIAKHVREKAWPQLEGLIGSDLMRGLEAQYK